MDSKGDRLEEIGQWKDLAPDILRRVLEFLQDHESVIACLMTCKPWFLAIDNRSTVWKTLCQHNGWPANDKEWFIAHWSAVSRYASSSIFRTQFNSGDRNVGGILTALPITQRTVYDWSSEKIVTTKPGMVLCAETGPSFAIKSWQVPRQHGSQPHVRVTSPSAELKLPVPANAPTGAYHNNELQFGAACLDECYALTSSSKYSDMYLTNLVTRVTRTFETKHASTITAAKLSPLKPNDAASAARGAWPVGYAVSGGYDHLTMIWDLRTGSHLLTFTSHSKTVWAVDVVRVDTGLWVSSAGSGSEIFVWFVPFDELRRPGLQQRKDKADRLAAALYTRLTTTVDEEVDKEITYEKLFPPEVKETEGEKPPIQGPTTMTQAPEMFRKSIMKRHGTCMSVCFAPDEPERFLFTGGYDAKIVLWDHTTETPLRFFNGHDSVVLSMHVTPHLLISGSRDCTVRVWDRHVVKASEEEEEKKTSNNIRLLSNHTADVKAVAVGEDGAIVSAGFDGVVNCWQFTGYNPNAPLDAKSMPNCIQS